MLAIGILSIAFGWLLMETDLLRIQLPCGKAKTEKEILMLTTTVDKILALPAPKPEYSYFMPCDIENEDIPLAKTIVNVGAKIL